MVPQGSEEVITSMFFSQLRRNSSPVQIMECASLLREICSRYGWCKKLLEYVALLQGLSESHGLPHTVRVLCNAFNIVDILGLDIDEEVLVLSVLLHDIGRGLEERARRHHALISAELAPGILAGLGIRREKIEKVKRAILEHSFSLGARPSFIESCVLSDADKLDALGAIGVYRLIETSAQRGRSIKETLRHVREKLVKLPSLMCFKETRELAEKKLSILLSLVEELEKESAAYMSAVEEAIRNVEEVLEKRK